MAKGKKASRRSSVTEEKHTPEHHETTSIYETFEIPEDVLVFSLDVSQEEVTFPVYDYEPVLFLSPKTMDQRSIIPGNCVLVCFNVI